MRDLAKNIRLPSIDDLFSTEEERQDAKLEKIQILPLSELHPFEGHPFQVRNDEEMDKMVDSVKEYGVMTPAIVRPRRDGGYEIVAAATPAGAPEWTLCPALCGTWTMIPPLY